MNEFLWAMAVFSVWSILGRLWRFVKSDYTRTVTEEAINVVGDLIVLVWAAVLIGKAMP